MSESCMYDSLDQCFRDCPGCVRADCDEPDPDEIYDMEREHELLED